MNRLHVLSRQLVASHASSSSDEGRCIVMGCSVMDLIARSELFELQRGTSVPGVVRQVHGGVGRNIVEGLSYLMSSGSPPTFISVLGDDAPGRSIVSHLKQLRLNTEWVKSIKDMTTPSVSCVLDRSGEVAACVADCSSIETRLTPEVASDLLDQAIGSCSPAKLSLLILEANLSEATLIAACTLARSRHISIFFEPVSVAKSLRCLPILGLLSYIKPNEAECRAIGSELRLRRGREPIQDRPLESGQGRIYRLIPYAAEILSASPSITLILTMGQEGAALVTLKSKRDTILSLTLVQIAALPVHDIKSANGAGDSLVASTVTALMRGKMGTEALSYGIAGAREALVCEGNVPCLDFDNLSSSAMQAHASLVQREVSVDLDGA
jgi:sugar/nucleoside kinase (ribokinase family)